MDDGQGGEHARGQGGVHFFEPSPPHFFKIILHDTIQSGKLSIPKKFARKYCGLGFSENQHQMVSLKLPSDDVWDVEMEVCEDGQLYLHGGWPKFVDFYGIKHGHFLTFKYKRRGTFHVRIFDSSTAEIRYPIKSSNNASKDQENVHFGEDQSRRDIEPQMPNESPNPQSPAQDEVVPTSSTENTIEVADTDVESDSGDETKPQMSGGGTVERDRAQEGASCSKSRKRNPYFSIVIRPSYVHKMLSIPAGFFVEHLVALENGSTVELCTSARRSWTVKYIYNICCNTRSCKLTTGWRGFVKDNKLEEGDVCVFELIKCDPIVFHVTISRAPKDQTFALRGGFNSSMPKESIQFSKSDKLRDGGVIKKTYDLPPGQPENEKSAPGQCATRKNYDLPPGQPEKDRSASLLRRSSFNSTNPSFSIVMQPSYIHRGILNLPREAFMGWFGSKSGSMVELCTSDGRSWTVKYHRTVCHNQAYCRLRGGWKEFVKDNDLEEGDLCVFKLIKPAPAIFHVTIHCKNMHRKRKLAALVPAPASNCTSKFRVVMKPCYLCGSNPAIPMRIAEKIFMLPKERVKIVKLETGDRTWSVKALYSRHRKLSAGWHKFVQENFLGVGDICDFELLDLKEPVMRVSIQRAKKPKT